MEFKTIINLILVFFVTKSLCFKNKFEENSFISIEKKFLDTFVNPTGTPPTTDAPSVNTGWSVNPPPTTDIPDPDGTTPTQSPDDTTTDSEESTTPPDLNSEHEWFIVSMVFIPAAAAASSVVLFLMCTMKEAVPNIGFIAPIVAIPRV